MNLLGYQITAPLVLTIILHIAGVWVLYVNKKDLLYDDEDKNPGTPATLSMGRCWSWLLFYLAFSFWLRYVMGEIPYTTPFPPGLQEMLYACLLYEFAKKGVDVSSILIRNRQQGQCGQYDGYNQPYNTPYGGSPYAPPRDVSPNVATDAPPLGAEETGPPKANGSAAPTK